MIIYKQSEEFVQYAENALLILNAQETQSLEGSIQNTQPYSVSNAEMLTAFSHLLSIFYFYNFVIFPKHWMHQVSGLILFKLKCGLVYLAWK